MAGQAVAAVSVLLLDTAAVAWQGLVEDVRTLVMA